MTLAAGTKLGPYEILDPLGAGGMGEVYRARDTRLGREVAVKVLPAAFSADAERLRRFEQEARAVSALNHPNILAVYDIGAHEGAPFLVTELLEGETLRERLRSGPLAVRKALDLAIQAAHGISAAHEKGIIHRDLKPANIFLTNDGRVKILDFGLAKLTQQDSSGLSDTQSPTRTAEPVTQTEAGVVLGTAGYMSPEQVRGKPADARSDIFALGTILYEMLSGQRAFEKDSSADTMAAILKEEPPELSGEGKKIPLAVDRIVRHCLEKNPAQRFQSARDLAFDLESLSGLSTTSAAMLAAAKSRVHPTWILPAVAALLLGAIAGFSFVYFATRQNAPSANISFRPLSFVPEAIFNARFAPDGQTVVFSAAPEGNVPELFVSRPDYPAPQSLGLADTELLSISSKGEIAVLTGARFVAQYFFSGTLARVELGGGAPRDILQNVQNADWSPDGSSLAIIREVNGQSRLEYPIGKVLYETAGYVSDLRFSPRGDQIAFFDHPARYDDRGSVDVVDLEGHRKVLSQGYSGEEGLAWAKDGATIYFGAWASGGDELAIHAVTLSGKAKTVLSGIGDMFCFDGNSNGNLLAMQVMDQYRLMALAPGAKAERDLSWLDSSTNPSLSADGRQLLFTDTDPAAGPNYALLLRQTDGSPVVRLGEGIAQGLSPDGQWALAIVPSSPMRLVLYPTGAGQPRVLPRGNIQSYESAQFLQDGLQVLFCGNEPGHSTRCYTQDIAGRAPRPVTPEGTSNGLVSPDGTSILAQITGGKYLIYPVAGGPASPVPWLNSDDVINRWRRDGHSLLVYDGSQIPAQVESVDLATGRRSLVRELAPADRAGVVRILHATFARGAKSYAYSYDLALSRLAVVEGVK